MAISRQAHLDKDLRVLAGNDAQNVKSEETNVSSVFILFMLLSIQKRDTNFLISLCLLYLIFLITFIYVGRGGHHSLCVSHGSMFMG